MRIPDSLSHAFQTSFEESLETFISKQSLIPEGENLYSNRFLARSIVPHLQKLSRHFNRLDEEEASDGLGPYWKKSSHPAHLRLSYFLYFMPMNLFRVASVWAELARLGFSWPKTSPLRAIEFGAGPAAGACGIAAGEKHAPCGIPPHGNWALIEQDKAMLRLGTNWADTYFTHQGFPDWGIRPFHRKLSFNHELLPPRSPRFNLWILSYVLNEWPNSADQNAQLLLRSLERHLEDEGIVILIEPALKKISRGLLELRKSLLKEKVRTQANWLQILLPCAGHQNCGALENPEDWCHEEATWWRPSYIKKLDQMTGLDHKSLPFSYLVLIRSQRTVEEILPHLKSVPEKRYRLVSPAHSEGRDLEFFLCGQSGKCRARCRTTDLSRGDFLLDAELEGNPNSMRVKTFKK